jgi:diacylglycerol kinase family enzyme
MMSHGIAAATDFEPDLHPKRQVRSFAGGPYAHCAHFWGNRCGGAGRGDEARRRRFIFGRACVGRAPSAGGGDGTVNAVAGKLAGTDTALGVLPMGTLNHFAKDVDIPLNLEAAVYNLFTGQIRKVDVGEVNGRVFVNNSGIGFYPHFVRQREEQERRGYVKRVAALLAVRALVRRYFRLRIKLHLDQAEALERLTPFLFVGNNRYETSGLDIGRRLKLDSGRLWVCTAPKTGRKNIWRAALCTLVGHPTDQDLNAFEVEEIWVDPGTARVNVSTDGEIRVMEAPLHYKIRPRALSVLVPNSSARNGTSALTDEVF